MTPFWLVLAVSAQPNASPETAPDRPEVWLSAPAEEGLARNGLSIKLALAASYQTLFTVPITSGELSAAFGGRDGSQAGYLTLHVQRGRTEFGLETWALHTGIATEWALDRLRIGAEGRLGSLWIERITSGGSLESFSFGARGLVAVDLLRFRVRDALYLELSYRGDYYSPLVHGPSMSLGYRFESNSRL